ncbi:hypothetical protein [Ottowia caeni]|uniref:hypothetical protein n=1 Tax=Ottowia caeni TaxID=2870339 RepID=UPI001E3C4520|nr:hypothetical protein [Ottowia caeni]
MRPSNILQAATLAAACLGGVAALAQAPSPTPSGPVTRESPVQHDRKTQRVEHIRVEDAGSRVDEVRSGGETKSITVQPKAGVPSYEVQPADSTGAGSPDASPGAAGKRVWKVLNF